MKSWIEIDSFAEDTWRANLKVAGGSTRHNPDQSGVLTVAGMEFVLVQPWTATPVDDDHVVISAAFTAEGWEKLKAIFGSGLIGRKEFEV